MSGILAFLAFALAFIFHGFGFAPNAWVSWTSLALLGLVFLAFHLLGGWSAARAVVVHKQAGQA